MEYETREATSVGKGDSIRRGGEKVVKIGDEAAWRQESRQEMTGRRAAEKREAQKCCRRRRQSSRAEADDFIGLFWGPAGEGKGQVAHV